MKASSESGLWAMEISTGADGLAPWLASSGGLSAHSGEKSFRQEQIRCWLDAAIALWVMTAALRGIILLVRPAGLKSALSVRFQVGLLGRLERRGRFTAARLARCSQM